MSPNGGKKQVGVSLLVRERVPGERTLYVYRDNGRGGPLGKHLVKTTGEYHEDEIRKQYGPGWFYLMEYGGDLPMKSERVYVEPDKDEPEKPETTSFLDPEFIETKKQLAMIRLYEREASGQVEMVDLMKTFAEIFGAMRAPGGSGQLEAFLEGLEFNPPSETPAPDPLSSVLQRATEKPVQDAGKWERVARLLHQQNKTLRTDLQEQKAELVTIKSKIEHLETPDFLEPEPEPVTPREHLIETLRVLAESGLTDLAPALTELGASAPDVARALLDSSPAEIRQVLREALSAAAMPDLFFDWEKQILALKRKVSPPESKRSVPAPPDTSSPEKTP